MVAGGTSSCLAARTYNASFSRGRRGQKTSGPLQSPKRHHLVCKTRKNTHNTCVQEHTETATATANSKQRQDGPSSLLLVHHVLQAPLDLRGLERGEPELGAPRLQRRDDLVDVVADHAESRVFRVLLDYCSERGREFGPAQRRNGEWKGEVRPTYCCCHQGLRRPESKGAGRKAGAGRMGSRGPEWSIAYQLSVKAVSHEIPPVLFQHKLLTVVPP